jgi:hypothetical protein
MQAIDCPKVYAPKVRFAERISHELVKDKLLAERKTSASRENGSLRAA